MLRILCCGTAIAMLSGEIAATPVAGDGVTLASASMHTEVAFGGSSTQTSHHAQPEAQMARNSQGSTDLAEDSPVVSVPAILAALVAAVALMARRRLYR